MKIYPHYPAPVQTKFDLFLTFFKRDTSWIDWVMQRSYTMYMGTLKMPGMHLHMPNDPELIHRIMITEIDLFPKNSFLHTLLQPLLGDSIFTTNGKVWKKQRELLNPSFAMVRVEHVFNLMNDAAKSMKKRLNALENGIVIDIDKEMTFVAADVIFRTILSEELDQKTAEEIVEAFDIFQEKNTKVGMHKVMKLPKFLLRFYGEAERLEAAATVRNILKDIIEPRHQEAEKGIEGSYTDILSSLLKVTDKDTGKAFSATELLDQVSMLFLAGHETSATTMSWTVYLLALYPDIQEQAYEEVLTHCADDEFSVENTKKLTLVTNILKESLRLYPPVSFIPRESKVETKMRNKQLKAGATVVVSPWLMHRNERYWEDPHMFNPERFSQSKNIHKFTYFPFGLGQRNCIGAGFAMQEGVLLLATVLRDYKLELEEGFVPKIASRLTTRSLNGMPIKLTRRYV